MKWSITRGAEEFGVARPTLRTALMSMGDEKLTGKYSTQEIHQALSGAGDKEKAQARESAARAAMLECKLLEKQRALVPMSDAITVINRHLRPAREAFLAAPDVLAARCNPSDPALAREAIEAWCANQLRICREVTAPTDPEPPGGSD